MIHQAKKSLSARRAWIEILIALPEMLNFTVALRKESVDRNKRLGLLGWLRVLVALRKESVDRNHAADISAKREVRSLSARRAWIEMAAQLVKADTGSRSPQGERG